MAARKDPQLRIAVDPDHPWLVLTLDRPLKWARNEGNFRKFIDLKVQSDGVSQIRIEANDIMTRFKQELVCEVDDDIRAAGAL